MFGFCDQSEQSGILKSYNVGQWFKASDFVLFFGIQTYQGKASYFDANLTFPKESK